MDRFPAIKQFSPLSCIPARNIGSYALNEEYNPSYQGLKFNNFLDFYDPSGYYPQILTDDSFFTNQYPDGGIIVKKVNTDHSGPEEISLFSGNSDY